MSAQVQPQRFVCLKCEHQWIENILIYVHIDVWCTHLRSIRCPNCRARFKRIAFQTEDASAA